MNDIINIEGLNVLYTETFNDSNPYFISLMVILFLLPKIDKTLL